MAAPPKGLRWMTSITEVQLDQTPEAVRKVMGDQAKTILVGGVLCDLGKSLNGFGATRGQLEMWAKQVNEEGGVPLMLDHTMEVRSVVGRTTEMTVDAQGVARWKGRVTSADPNVLVPVLAGDIKGVSWHAYDPDEVVCSKCQKAYALETGWFGPQFSSDCECEDAFPQVSKSRLKENSLTADPAYLISSVKPLEFAAAFRDYMSQSLSIRERKQMPNPPEQQQAPVTQIPPPAQQAAQAPLTLDLVEARARELGYELVAKATLEELGRIYGFRLVQQGGAPPSPPAPQAPAPQPVQGRSVAGVGPTSEAPAGAPQAPRKGASFEELMTAHFQQRQRELGMPVSDFSQYVNKPRPQS